MPLTDCPDCGRQVSTLAPACPHCGCPGASTRPVQLVEQTAKEHKGRMAWGGVGAGCGTLLIFVSVAFGSTVGVVVGMCLALVGAVGYGVAATKAWWHHG